MVLEPYFLSEGRFCSQRFYWLVNGDMHVKKADLVRYNRWKMDGRVGVHANHGDRGVL